MISNRVMKIGDYKGMILYRAACACGSTNHDLTLVLEYDEKVGDITLSIYNDTEWLSDFTSRLNPFQKLWERIKAALRILFTGYLSTQSELIIDSEEQIIELKRALEEGVEKLHDNNR